MNTVKTWQQYLILGVLLGLALQAVGIYGDMTAPRLIGAALPLAAVCLGAAVEARRRRQLRQD